MLNSINSSQSTEITVSGRGNIQIHVLFYPVVKSNAPLLIDIHGGGFVSGHHFADDSLCRLFRQKLDINVASIEYRYAPEVVYPTATEDSFDAMTALYSNSLIDFDRSSIFLIGHSAGGNIVAGLSLLSIGKLPLRGQILDYPFLDAVTNPFKRKYVPYSIPALMMKSFNDRYFPDKPKRSEVLASPVLITSEQAAQMPSTLVLTCGHDSLRQDGYAYVERLRSGRGAVQQIEFQDAVHGFIETVANDTMKNSWWLPHKLLEKQKSLFSQAITDICSFIKKEME